MTLFWSTAQLVAAQKGEEPEGEVLFGNVRFFWSYFGAVLSRYLGIIAMIYWIRLPYITIIDV